MFVEHKKRWLLTKSNNCSHMILISVDTQMIKTRQDWLISTNFYAFPSYLVHQDAPGHNPRLTCNILYVVSITIRKGGSKLGFGSWIGTHDLPFQRFVLIQYIGRLTYLPLSRVPRAVTKLNSRGHYTNPGFLQLESIKNSRYV